MIEISFRQFPPENAIFAPNAFEESVGREIPFKMEGAVIQATVVHAVVSNDGHWAVITVNLPVTFPFLFDDLKISMHPEETDE